MDIQSYKLFKNKLNAVQKQRAKYIRADGEALLKLPSWCLVMVERLFLTVPQGCLRFVIVVFPAHTHLLFLT